MKKIVFSQSDEQVLLQVGELKNVRLQLMPGFVLEVEDKNKKPITNVLPEPKLNSELQPKLSTSCPTFRFAFCIY